VLSLLPHPKSCGNRYRCLVTSLEVVDFIGLKFILIQGLTYLLSLILCISNQKGNESMENQYTVKQLVEFAKNEMFELGYATEEQLDQVIEIFNNEGLAGDDLFTVWDEINNPDYSEFI
jgi:hypothetical protein